MAVPDLSIVIPTFNTGPMTLHCARTVLAALPPSAEIIVVDDGSTDGTEELLARELPDVTVVRLDENRGFAPAANRGVAASRGSIVLLLNSDALVAEGALEALLAAFDTDARLGMAGAQLLDADGAPQWSGGPAPTLLWMIGVVSGLGHLARVFRRAGREKPAPDWVSGAAMAFRREVWTAAGPLDERYLFYCQDIDFCLRARAAGWRVALIPEARVTHARGGTVARDRELGYDPERLWSDLLTWGRGQYGSRWARFARPILIAVAWLRIVGRWLRFRRDETTRAMIRGARGL
jgi:N-acetylglucosaminyl-diphospho-decaprenol L-rhamnosyltransferase